MKKFTVKQIQCSYTDIYSLVSKYWELHQEYFTLAQLENGSNFLRKVFCCQARLLLVALKARTS
jgi:hypothetical protein